MSEVTKGMDNESDGPITHQGNQISQNNTDDDPVESDSEDATASILSHVGDILFQHGQISTSDSITQSTDSKAPETFISSRKYDTIHELIKSPIPQIEVTLPAHPAETISNLQFQPDTEWQLSSLLRHGSQARDNVFALLVLNQPIENKSIFKVVWRKALFRIAADGAGNRLLDIGRDPYIRDLMQSSGYQLDVICGDLDSLEPTARQSFESRGTRIVHIKDQDSTDFQKCTNYLRDIVLPTLPNPSNILCLGGLGGRVDQGLSQLHQLYKEQHKQGYRNGRIYLLTAEALTFVLLSGRHRIHVRDETAPPVLGRHIGIIPLKEPCIITTKGLEWDVTDWKTEFGGLMSTSNLVREDIVEVTTSHDVLFTIDLDSTSTEKGPERRR